MTARHAAPVGRPASWARRLVALVLIAFVGGVVGGAVVPRPGSADGPATASAQTRAGAGPFADLEVTVSQTRSLINQVVEVTWRGGRPTQPSVGSFSVDFLQIFQCWGDAESGPDREQCQFGAFAGDNRGGQNVASRQLNQGGLVDPAEPLTAAPPAGNVYLPFRSVTGRTTTGPRSEFFDGSTSNEIPLARTRPDGKGQEFFEVQTAREAPGLGCGATLGSGSTAVGRGCWLVVVPRGDREVDGSTRTTSAINQLESSALSSTNWAQRIVFPLSFSPLGQTCPLGAAERRTVGNETVVEAISRWQPTLCASGERVFGFSQVPEATGRRVLAGEDPGLVFVGRTVDPAELDGARVAYAPVALSGLGVAFNIDSLSAFDAPPEVALRDATRIGELNLTPRLVAKLVTQSYRLAVDASAEHVRGNPLDLTRDPEFRALNPAFAPLSYPAIPDALLPTGLTDDARHVWEWLAADPEAKAFLAGAPDPFGMTVNPRYRGLRLPQDGFPKADPYCKEFGNGQPPLCTLDAHPYAADLHDAARSASRGDTLVRTTYDPLGTPPGYRKSSAQPVGARYVLAITDTTSAARYGLPMAKLRNRSGAFVAPTDAALLAAAAALPAPRLEAAPQVPVVTTTPAAYPLTFLSYAATVPSRLDAAARADYAALLRYAVGPGQVPGDVEGRLPRGYAPLPDVLRVPAARLAAELVAPVVPVTPVVRPSAAPTGTASAPPVALPLTPVSPVLPVASPPAPAGLPLPVLPGGATPPPAAPAQAAPSLGLVRPVAVGASEQYAVWVATALGLLAVVVGPLLRRGRPSPSHRRTR